MNARLNGVRMMDENVETLGVECLVNGRVSVVNDGDGQQRWYYR